MTTTLEPELDYSARNNSRASYAAKIPIDQIERWEEQPRRHFDETALDELAGSIAEHGLLEPLVVRPIGQSRYSLIAGERRWRACQRAGVRMVHCEVRDVDDATALQLALLENLQRVDLDPVEEARSYAALNRICGLRQEDIGAAVKRSQSAIANTMRLLDLPESVLEMISDGRLTRSHGVALAKYAKWPALCERIVEKVLQYGWTSKIIEAGFSGAGSMSSWEIGHDLIAAIPYAYRAKAAAAGLTVWDDIWTPDVDRLKAMADQWETEIKAEQEAAIEKAREAARRAAAGDPVPGRDPNTKNGRRRLAKDAERIARHEEEMSVAEKAAALNLPMLADLAPGSYERVRSDTYAGGWPKACGPDCECRAQALDYNGEIVEISTRPRHISSLRGKEERARKEAQKKKGLDLTERLQVALDTAPSIDPRGLAIVAGAVFDARVGPYDPEKLVEGGIRDGLLTGAGLKAGQIMNGTTSGNVAEMLAGLDPDQLVRLMVGAVLLTDARRVAKDAAPVSSRLKWYLQAPIEAEVSSPTVTVEDDARETLMALLHDYEILDPDEEVSGDEVLLLFAQDLLALDGLDEEHREDAVQAIAALSANRIPEAAQ